MLDPKAVRAAFGPFDLRAAQSGEIAEGRAWAAGMIGPGIATTETLKRVHQHMGEAALFVRREPAAITGMLGWIALTEAGLQAVLDMRFSGQDPDAAHVAAPGQTVAAGYGWGVAGSHKEAARAVLSATTILNYEIFGSIPFFARAATPAGRRVIVEAFHYDPAPMGDPDLFWKPAGRPRAA